MFLAGRGSRLELVNDQKEAATSLLERVYGKSFMEDLREVSGSVVSGHDDEKEILFVPVCVVCRTMGETSPAPFSPSLFVCFSAFLLFT